MLTNVVQEVPPPKISGPQSNRFLSNRGFLKDPGIILSENNNIISDQTSVSNIQFEFKPVTQENIQALISKCSSKKATGIDGIPAKVDKSCCRTIAKPLFKLINYSLANSTFPNRLKLAQVIPVYKKNDPLDKHNYRPISILPFMSKRFEKSINLQLNAHFENFFNPFLGSFCQTTLLRLVEDWRRVLDCNEYVAAILMDLSRAFDSLPRDLLLGKLRAYFMGSLTKRVLLSVAT